MEKWNELCYILSENLPSNISEQLFELKVVQAFEKLGWSEYKDEIVVRKSIQLGSQRDRMSPDLVLQLSEKGKQFVVEVKKPNISFNSGFNRQLKSYMRQLKLEVGILIGEKIQIFYDGDIFDSNQLVLLDEIEFKRDNLKGLNFIELFNRENYEFGKIEILAKKKSETLKDKLKLDELKTEILSSKFNEKITELIKSQLTEKYNPIIIEKAFSKIKISLLDNSIKENISEFQTSKKPKNSLNLDKREQGYLAIGKYVRKTLNELIDNNLIDRDEIVKLQREDYSIDTFHIRYPFLRKVLISDNKKVDKYWKPIIVIKGEKYFVCSEWYEVPANNDRPYYEKWLRKMKN